MYAVSVPNEPQTPRKHHGTPAFAVAAHDWAWHVGGEQRQLLRGIVSRGSALPSPDQLAVIIRKHSAAREAAVRELIDAALVVDGALDDARLAAAIRAVHQHFG
jgi:hypothetical protein